MSRVMPDMGASVAFRVVVHRLAADGVAVYQTFALGPYTSQAVARRARTKALREETRGYRKARARIESSPIIWTPEHTWTTGGEQR